MSYCYAWRDIATGLTFINAKGPMCLFEKPHPNSSGISSFISQCPGFSSGKRQKQNQTNKQKKKKRKKPPWVA